MDARSEVRLEALRVFYDTFMVNEAGPCFDPVSKMCKYVKVGHPGCAIGALPQFKELLLKNPELGEVKGGITNMCSSFEAAKEVFGNDLFFWGDLQELHDGDLVTYSRDKFNTLAVKRLHLIQSIQRVCTKYCLRDVTAE